MNHFVRVPVLYLVQLVRSSKLCSFKTNETLCLHASKLHALRSARDVIIQGDMRACAATGINSLLCLQ
jgi:hypothetical protein